MRRLAALLIIVWLALPAPAEANPFCSWLGLCFYYSPGFELAVVDAETGTPMTAVYAWVEWVQYTGHGTAAYVVQDGFSDAAGRFSFPRWGPMKGSRFGLPIGQDPAVILFKPGYATLLVQNRMLPGASHYAAIRGFTRHGETVKMERFQGSPSEWVEQVQKLAYPGLHGIVPDAHRDRFGPVYLRRAGIAVYELRRLPPETGNTPALLMGLDRSMRFYRGEE